MLNEAIFLLGAITEIQYPITVTEIRIVITGVITWLINGIFILKSSSSEFDVPIPRIIAKGPIKIVIKNALINLLPKVLPL